MQRTRDPQRQLSYIRQWAPYLPASEDLAIASPAQGGGGYNPEALPFRLHCAMDFDDEGAFGVRTADGVYRALRAWADNVADTLGDRAGAAAGDPAGYLMAVWQRAKQAMHGDEVEALAEDVDTIYSHIASTVGLIGEYVGHCPACGDELWCEATTDGIIDLAVCDGCDRIYNRASGELTAAYIALIAARTPPDAFLPIDQALRIAKASAARPLGAATLRQWARRGKVKTRRSRHTARRLYNLKDILDRVRGA